MSSQITNYQCPACTGPLQYAGGSGKLECEYCGSFYEIAEIEALYDKKEEKAEQAFEKAEKKQFKKNEWDVSGLGNDWGEDAEKMRAYSCPSCGAELICDETTAATSCPYCGNPTVVPGQFSGAMKPDYIIPFKLDKKAAVAALKEHYKGKKLIPDVFTEENHIQEIKGVYVPFWFFDGKARAEALFNAQKVTVIETTKKRTTRTEYFDVKRAGEVTFEKVPTDAASKMPDEYMDSIEPFNYSELRAFSTAYLPGYYADKYDVSVEECAKRANKRATNTAVQFLQDQVIGYDFVQLVNQHVELLRGQVHYALLPVWMLNTKWNGENYLFAVNGQTGKTVGKLPVDKRKYRKQWILTTVGWFVGMSTFITIMISLFF